MTKQSSNTAMVVGANRDLGNGIAVAVAEAFASVVAVSRTSAAFLELAPGSGTVQPEAADAGEATVAASLLSRHEPEAVVLVAVASPAHRRVAGADMGDGAN